MTTTATSYANCQYWNDGYAVDDTDCRDSVANLYSPRVNKDAFWRAVRAREMRDQNYRS